MKKKEVLVEMMGVPKVITPWVNSFTKIIIDVLTEEIKNGYDDKGYITFEDEVSGEEIEDFVYKTNNITIPSDKFMEMLMKINGYSDMGDFIKSDMFKGLPLWRPKISFDVVAIPDELYEKKQPQIGASVSSELTQKLSKISKISVLPNIVFKFNIIVPIGNFNNHNYFLSELKTTISHELLHVYQKIKQLESGLGIHYGKETMLNALATHPTLNQIELTWWKKFLYLVYLHLSFEINARVTQTYYGFEEKGVKTKEHFLSEIKKTKVWAQMKLLEDFNAEEYIKEFELPLNDSNFNPLEMLHSILGGETEKQSLTKMGVDVSSKEEVIKSLIVLWDKILRIGTESIKLRHGIDFNMLPIPENVKKNPYLFFKFFEKRFHKKAEKWKRKLYRISSLLTQQEQPNQ